MGADHDRSSRSAPTIVLAEPDAGSTSARARTKAVQQRDDLAHDGVKRFITSGEPTIGENTCMACVLARPANCSRNAGTGHQGPVRLFFVPTFTSTRTGELVQRNGAYVTNVRTDGPQGLTNCDCRLGQDDVTRCGWPSATCTTASRRCSRSSSRSG